MSTNQANYVCKELAEKIINMDSPTLAKLCQRLIDTNLTQTPEGTDFLNYLINLLNDDDKAKLKYH